MKEDIIHIKQMLKNKNVRGIILYAAVARGGIPRGPSPQPGQGRKRKRC